ncbi:MAG: bifunctional glycosyltransferase family 2/GtrA family protein [Oscillospiraceae bacterium]
MVVVIPAYEPDERLIELVAEIREKTGFRVLVVNDASSSAEVFAALGEDVTVLTHAQNCGKGRAMKTALDYLSAHPDPRTDGVVFVDADGQHRVDDMIRLCAQLAANPGALLIGARAFSGKIPLRSKFGNTVTRYVFAFASGVRVSDTQTGLRAFSADLIPYMAEIAGERYEYEMNVLLRCASDGVAIREIPIETVYTDKKNSSSHFRALRDSARIYKAIIKFSSASFVSFLADYLLFTLFSLITGGFLPKGRSIIVSNITARVFSASFNYWLNKKYVFNSRDRVLTSAAKYAVLAGAILAVNTALVYFLGEIVGLPNFAAKLITETMLFVLSMVVQRVYVFKAKAPPAVKPPISE